MDSAPAYSHFFFWNMVTLFGPFAAHQRIMTQSLKNTSQLMI